MGHAKELSGPDLAAGIELSELSEGAPLLGHAHGDAVMLVRRGTTIRAVGATCTHYSGPLAEGLVVGETVRCPWHPPVSTCVPAKRSVRPLSIRSRVTK